MGYFSTRLKHIFSTRFTQAAVFIGLVVITALCIALQASWGAWLQRGPKSAHVQPPNKAVHAADLTVHAELSQTKLVQGQTATVYVNLGIQTPTPIKLISAGNAEHGGALVSRAPTDLVVVLDRSPSMLAAMSASLKPSPMPMVDKIMLWSLISLAILARACGSVMPVLVSPSDSSMIFLIRSDGCRPNMSLARPNPAPILVAEPTVICCTTSRKPGRASGVTAESLT